jgi:hypothetical protein
VSIEELRTAFDPKNPPIVEYLDPDMEKRTAWLCGVGYGTVTLQSGNGVLIEGVHPENVLRVVGVGE